MTLGRNSTMRAGKRHYYGGSKHRRSKRSGSKHRGSKHRGSKRRRSRGTKKRRRRRYRGGTSTPIVDTSTWTECLKSRPKCFNGESDMTKFNNWNSECVNQVGPKGERMTGFTFATAPLYNGKTLTTCSGPALMNYSTDGVSESGSF